MTFEQIPAEYFLPAIETSPRKKAVIRTAVKPFHINTVIR